MKDIILIHYLFISFFVFFIDLIIYLNWHPRLHNNKEYPFAKVVCHTVFWPLYFIKFLIPKAGYFLVESLNLLIYDIIFK